MIKTGIITARKVPTSFIFVDIFLRMRNCSLGSRFANVDRQLTGLSLSSES